MSPPTLPTLVQPGELEPLLGSDDLLIIDLQAPEKYAAGHVPGAVNASYSDFVAGQRPTMGLLPPLDRLSQTLSSLGFDTGKHVVAYDDEGGGRGARVLWTLHVLGQQNCSLLDGGIVAWANEGHNLQEEPVTPVTAQFQAQLGGPQALATKDYVLSKLGDRHVVILDARSAGEYAGSDARAARGGHIPGAVNLDWVASIDLDRNLRMLPEARLRTQLQSIGATPDKEIVVYCQTHHRSSHSYAMLKHLDYPQVRGYAGAWSEWGNDPLLPIEA